MGLNEFWLQSVSRTMGQVFRVCARKISCVLFLAWGEGEEGACDFPSCRFKKKKHILHHFLSGPFFCAGKYVMYEVCTFFFCHRLAWVLFEARGIVSV